MYVNTLSNPKMEFKLSGREIQESINEDKYLSLAYSNTRGLALADLVEERWASWVAKVETAPWLRNWVRSPLRDQVATTPRGQICENACSGIALAIYINTVWGIGIDNWLRGPAQALLSANTTALGSASGKAKVNEPMVCILKLQNVRCPNQARTYMWDEVLYRGCGTHLPIEVGELDRWLEPLWLEVLERESEARKQQYRNSLK